MPSDAMQKSLTSELIADMKASNFFWSFASSDLFPENGTIQDCFNALENQQPKHASLAHKPLL